MHDPNAYLKTSGEAAPIALRPGMRTARPVRTA
jgi:hypothetical protein